MIKRPTREDTKAALKDRWKDQAERRLLGRRITAVRWMTAVEQDACGWNHAAVVLLLDDGQLIWPAADDEGNDAGSLFGVDQSGNDFTFPVIG